MFELNVPDLYLIVGSIQIEIVSIVHEFRNKILVLL